MRFINSVLGFLLVVLMITSVGNPSYATQTAKKDKTCVVSVQHTSTVTVAPEVTVNYVSNAIVQEGSTHWYRQPLINSLGYNSNRKVFKPAVTTYKIHVDPGSSNNKRITNNLAYHTTWYVSGNKVIKI